MALLADEDAQFLREQFAALAHDVRVTVVTRQRSRLIALGEPEPAPMDDPSEEVRQIVAELAATSPRIQLETLDADADAARAGALVGARLPAIVLGSERSRGRLRYYGLPAGYEMSTMVAAVMDLGGDEELIPAPVGERLGALAKDVHIQVFVTPS